MVGQRAAKDAARRVGVAALQCREPGLSVALDGCACAEGAAIASRISAAATRTWDMGPYGASGVPARKPWPLPASAGRTPPDLQFQFHNCRTPIRAVLNV